MVLKTSVRKLLTPLKIPITLRREECTSRGGVREVGLAIIEAIL